MSRFSREESRETDDGMRTISQPHPHWENNLRYVNEQIQSSLILSKLDKMEASVYWEGTEKDIIGNWRNLTCVAIAWEDLRGKHGRPFSLHQCQNKFIEEWERFFGLNGGPISKRGVYVPTSKDNRS